MRWLTLGVLCSRHQGLCHRRQRLAYSGWPLPAGDCHPAPRTQHLARESLPVCTPLLICCRYCRLYFAHRSELSARHLSGAVAIGDMCRHSRVRARSHARLPLMLMCSLRACKCFSAATSWAAATSRLCVSLCHACAGPGQNLPCGCEHPASGAERCSCAHRSDARPRLNQPSGEQSTLVF